MYAVIKTGGKQYRVAANDKILIEKLEGAAGDQVQFAEVLMVANGGAVEIGAPHVAGATVVGEIAAQEKADTVYIFKKRRRKHYRRRNGHRQLLTSVTITDILTGGAKPAVKAKAEKKADAPVVAAPVAVAAPVGDDTKAKPAKAAKKAESDDQAEKKPATKKASAKAAKPADKE